MSNQVSAELLFQIIGQKEVEAHLLRKQLEQVQGSKKDPVYQQQNPDHNGDDDPAQGRGK